ncbi:hypothetical protein ANCCEY_09261 [Ancylostoma ceylanicum]|uniref:CRIM domain-containing protein n=1 Tax=Ancylostoma ceylanicum TaxID=53326 RepID=A0A0D6LHT9_9BILA|nr:hypothetical protein ANCCEY_09261 [Ancylostoma ceylanicum]
MTTTSHFPGLHGKNMDTHIVISVQPTAKVGEVIGYRLYHFFRDFGIALRYDSIGFLALFSMVRQYELAAASVDDFQLLMADDSGEIELDLHPLDNGAAICDLGFTVLAMVSKKGSMSSESKETHRPRVK